MTADTSQFVLHFLLEESIGKAWKDWAYRNYESGYDYESLMDLIVLDYPANQFEAREIVEHVFTDLFIDVHDVRHWLCAYVDYVRPACFRSSLQEMMLAIAPLKELYERNMFGEDSRWVSLQEFYLLYYGLYNLEDADVQWSHPELRADNVKDVIERAFQTYKIRYCTEDTNP